MIGGADITEVGQAKTGKIIYHVETINLQTIKRMDTDSF